MISEQQWEVIGRKIMNALPGIKREAESNFMAEPHTDGTTYIKFTSDHGVTDDHNGVVLSAYLRTNGAVVKQERLRSMIVQDADLIRLFLD